MDELIEHLSPENEQNVLEMHNFGEVTRILYRNLYVAARGRANAIRITQDQIEFFKDEILVGQTKISAFKNAQISFREKLVRVLEKDKVLAQYVRITKHEEDEVVAQFIW